MTSLWQERAIITGFTPLRRNKIMGNTALAVLPFCYEPLIISSFFFSFFLHMMKHMT